MDGFKFSPVNEEEYLMVNSDLKVYFNFTEDPVNLYLSNSKIKGTITGPGFEQGQAVEGSLAMFLQLSRDFFSLKGEYVLSNIRIDTGEQEIYAYPSVVNIHVIDKILSTSVETSLLSLEELEALGIQTDSSNYTGYNISISLGFESGVETLSIPILLSGTTFQDVDGEVVAENGSALVEGIKFPSVASGSCGGGTGLLNPPPSDGGGGVGEPIPAIVYFPGNVGFLHNFFKSVLIVINTTSKEANILVDNLTASAVLPKGRDGNYGTPENPGDDPLRVALTENGREQTKPIVNPGADGKLGTDDDSYTLNSGETGISFFLLEGLQEGTHTVQYDFKGEMHINGGSAEIKGSASGVVLVRNPDLSVQFTHPDTVRANMPYDMTVTVKNTSNVPANLTYIQFDEHTMVGGIFLDESDNPLSTYLKLPVLNSEGQNTLNPGETGIVKLRVMPLITGKIVSSYIRAEAGTVSLALVHGVDDREVGLSPDMVKMSWHFYELPENYRTALDLVIGDALSVATDPELPEGVIRILGRGTKGEDDEVQNLANHMMFGGMYYNLSEDISSIVFRNILDFRTVSLGVEQLIRTSYAGKQLKKEEIFYLSKKLQEGDEVFFKNFLKVICDNSNYRVLLINNCQEVELKENETGLTANLDKNNIPGSVFYSFVDKTLILLPTDENRAFSLYFKGTEENVSVFNGDFKTVEKLNFSSNSKDKNFKLKINGHVIMTADLDNNGSYEVKANSITETIEFPELNILKVKQLDPEYFPEVSGLDLRFSDTLLVLFNRKLNPQEVIEKKNYAISKNNVIGATLQAGGRASILQLQKPVGNFFDRAIEFGSIYDIYKEFSVEGIEQPIEMSQHLLGYMVEGNVYNSDGEPLANSFISVYSDFGQLGGRNFYFKTDELGHYLVEQINLPSSARFKVRYGNKMRRPVVSGRFEGQRIKKDIYFTGTGDVSVTVLDELGNPASDVSLSLNHHTEMYHRTLATDELGHALFKKVHMGAFSIHAVKQLTGNNQIEKVWTGIAGGKLIKKGSTLEVTVYLESKRGSVKGKVLEETADNDGNTVYIPMSHQAVVVFANFENTGGGYQCYNCDDETTHLINGQTYVPVAWQYTNEQGEFEIDNIPTGKVFFEVSTDLAFYTGTGVSAPFLLKKDDTLDVTLVKVSGTSAVFGQVTYFDGTPAVAAKISINGRGGTYFNYTDAQGNFRFDNLPPGKWTIMSEMGKSYHAISDVDILTVNEEVECNLKFDPVGRIAGKLFASDGVTPLSGYMVIIPPYKKDGVLYDPYTGAAIPLEQRTCITDAQGNYHFDNLKLGAYDLTCTNGLRVANTKVSILEPGKTFVANMYFLPAGKVKGKVVQADGVTGAVAKVTLRCNFPSQNESSFGKITYGQLGEIVTDSNGEFEFPTVNAGNINLVAKNFFASDNASFDAFLKTEGEEISVVLRLGEQFKGRIGGRVFLPDGISLAGKGVDVKLISRKFPEINLKTNEKSEFLSPDILPPGSYQIVVLEKTTGYSAKANVSLSKNGSTFKDIRLKGFGSVLIKIKELDGNPVTEGILRLQNSGCNQESGLVTIMFNNNEGIVNISNVCEGDFSVSVISTDGLAGRATGKISRNGQKVELEITVEGYGNVIGTVFDSDGETPIGDVELTLYSLKTKKPVAYGTTSGMTNDLGSYNFPYLPLDDYVLVCFDVVNGRFGQGYFSVNEHKKTEIANISLTGSGTVEGKVINGDGTPASNIQIEIKAKAEIFGNDMEINNFTKVELTSTTAPDGSFKFENIPISKFQLYAHDDETGISGFVGSEIKNNLEVVNCNVQMVSSGNVKVKVIDYFGNAYQYAVVSLNRYPFTNGGKGEILNITAISDGRGNAVFTSVPEGYLTVSAKDTKGFVIGEKKVELHNQGEEIQIVLQSPGRGKVFGQVVFADGSKVENGIVTLFGNGIYKRIAITNGAYLFENIVFGNYVVRAESGIQKKEVDLALSEDMLSGCIDIALNPTGTLSGTVVDANGEVMANNPVNLVTGRNYFGTAVTNSEGKFSFTLVPFGDFSLSTYHRASGKRGVAGGEINETMQNPEVTITLESLGSVRGIVVGKGGNPFLAPNMSVTYRNINTHYRKAVQVTGDGKFRIDNVPVGPYSLYYQDGYYFSASDTGELTEDNQIIDNHEFVLDNYKKIYGVVKNIDGTEAVNCDVKIIGHQYRNIRTDENGLFQCDYIIDGIYNVIVSDLEKIHTVSKRFSTSDTVGDEINITLQFGDNIKLRGYVFQNDNRVRSTKITESSGAFSYTNSDGEYVLIVQRQESGTYSLTAQLPTRIPLYGYRSFTLASDENIDGAVISVSAINIEETGTIAGQFKKINSSEPISGVTVGVNCRNSVATVYSKNDGTFSVPNIPFSEPISIDITYGGYYGYKNKIENIVLSGDYSIGTVEIDTTPPVVEFTKPGNATDLQIPGEIEFNISDADSSIDFSKAVIKINGSNIAGNFSYIGNKATLKLESLVTPFKFGRNSVVVWFYNTQEVCTVKEYSFEITKMPTTISGVVHTADGLSVEAGIELTCTNLDTGGDFLTTTGHGGVYKFENVLKGRFLIEADRETIKECIKFKGEITETKPDVTVNLRFYKYCVLSGTIFKPLKENETVFSHTEDVDKAEISVERNINNQNYIFNAESDIQGNYTLKYLPIGSYFIFAKEKNGTHITETKKISFYDEFREKSADFHYFALGKIKGNIYSAQGDKITSGTVYCQSIKIENGSHLYSSSDYNANQSVEVSDGEFGYSFENVLEGHIKLRVVSDSLVGETTSTIDFENDEKIVDITLEPNRTVEGTVKLADGTVPENIEVQLFRNENSFVKTINLEADGKFKFSYLGDYNYFVTATCVLNDKNYFVKSENFGFSSGNSVELGELILVEDEKPEISSTAVTPAVGGYVSSSFKVDYSVSDDSQVKKVTVNISGVYEDEKHTYVNRQSYNGYFNIDIPADADLSQTNKIYIKIIAIDSVGQTVATEPYEYTLLIDTTPPVLSVSLDNGEQMETNHHFELPPVSFHFNYSDSETAINLSNGFSVFKINGVTQYMGTNYTNVYFSNVTDPLKFGENTYEITVGNNAGLTSSLTGTFYIDSGYNLSGKVYDPDGNLVGAGNKITIKNANDAIVEVMTDSAGNYNFTGLKHSVTYNILSDLTDEFLVAKDQLRIMQGQKETVKDLHYYKYGNLSVKVFRGAKQGEDSNINELLTKTIELKLSGEENKSQWISTGTFNFDYLPLGNYEIFGKLNDGVAPETEKIAFNLKDGDNIQNIELHMPALNYLSGKIFDSAGNLQSNHCKITIIDKNSGENLFADHFYYGHYSIQNIPKGDYQLLAYNFSENIFNKDEVVVTVEYDGEVQEKNIILENSKSITGKIMLEDGVTPAVHAKVYFDPASTSYNSKTVYTDANGEFELNHLYKDNFALTISYDKYKPTVISSNFENSDSLNIGTVSLEKNKEPKVTVVLDRNTAYRDDYYSFNIEIEADVNIKSYGYEITGVIEDSDNSNIYGNYLTLTRYEGISIPYDCPYGEFHIKAYAIDSAGLRGESQEVTVNVESRFRSLEGTVYRKDGVTPAVNATVNGYVTVVYFSNETGEKTTDMKVETTTDSTGYFYIEEFIDVSRSEDFRGYYFKVYIMENDKIELFENEGSIIPETNLKFEKIVLQEVNPELPTVEVEFNSDIPIMADTDSEKAFMIHCSSKYEITQYGYEITGLYEVAEEFDVMNEGGEGEFRKFITEAGMSSEGVKKNGEITQRMQSGDAKGAEVSISAEGAKNKKITQRRGDAEVCVSAEGAKSGGAKGIRNSKFSQEERILDMVIFPPITGDDLPDIWENGEVSLKIYVKDEFGRKTYFTPINLKVVHRECDISGKVLFEDGTPVSKAAVKVIEYISDYCSSENGGGTCTNPNKRIYFDTITDEQGNFKIEKSYIPSYYFHERIDVDYEYTEEDGEKEIKTIVTLKGKIHKFQLEISYFTEGKKGKEIVPITELPKGNVEMGDITLESEIYPLVVVKKPYDGFIIKGDGSVDINVYVKAQKEIVSVTSEINLQGNSPCPPVELTDNGVDNLFNYAFETDFVNYSGTLTCDLTNAESQSILLTLKIKDEDGVESEKQIPLYLTQDSTGLNNNLDLVYLTNLTNSPAGLPEAVLPVHFSNSEILREVIPILNYENPDLNFIKTQISEGYGEVENTDKYSSVFNTKLLIKTMYDWCGGNGCIAEYFATVELPKLPLETVFITTDEFNMATDYSDKIVVLTEGEIEISENKTFKTLIISSKAHLKVVGSTEVTCIESFTLLPDAQLINSNESFNPKVTLTAPDMYIYGDYSGKANGSNVIIFNGNKQEH